MKMSARVLLSTGILLGAALIAACKPVTATQPDSAAATTEATPEAAAEVTFGAATFQLAQCDDSGLCSDQDGNQYQCDGNGTCTDQDGFQYTCDANLNCQDAAPAPDALSEAPAEAPAEVPAEAPTAAPTDAPAAAPAASGGAWRIQLGAFGVASNADAMWAKVKGRAEVAGHARLNAPSGKVTRLLATGYSEGEAQAACKKLSAAGISCLATRN